MIAEQLHLSVTVIVGLVIFGGCVFVAGWVARGEYDLWRRACHGVGTRRRWADSDRERGGFIGRSPW